MMRGCRRDPDCKTITHPGSTRCTCPEVPPTLDLPKDPREDDVLGFPDHWKIAPPRLAPEDPHAAP